MSGLGKRAWWAVCQLLRPDITREEYEAQWAAFVEAKRGGDCN